MTISPYSEWFTIYEFMGDENGLASIQGICEYMQEAAGNHAAKLGLSIGKLHSEGVAWVLARMRLKPEKLPAMHARIVVETWPVGVEGLQYRRDFIVRGEDGAVLLRAVSHWVVVSLQTRKVGRVPAFIAEKGLANASGATAMDDMKRRLPQAGKEHEICDFRARLSDMDRNHHVNNVRYMDWIIESVPGAVRNGNRLIDLELTFRAEAYRDDLIAARTMPDADDDLAAGALPGAKCFCHSLVRKSDDKELVRAKSMWM